VRFLADESCDFAVVTALRTAGHDVSAVVEISPRSKDLTSAHSGIGGRAVHPSAISSCVFAAASARASHAQRPDHERVDRPQCIVIV